MGFKICTVWVIGIFWFYHHPATDVRNMSVHTGSKPRKWLLTRYVLNFEVCFTLAKQNLESVVRSAKLLM